MLAERVEPEACHCRRCVSYCDRPGWGLIAEMESLIEQGHAKSLMLDWWDADGEMPYIEILAPAINGFEGQRAPDMLGGPFGMFPVGGCTFLKRRRCQVHDSGAKPFECRMAHHLNEDAHERVPADHKAIAQSWGTPEGKALANRWKRITGVA